ncbi:MAG TPA: tetratricopeptide repeat protein, partial [Tepidisphaeraceae bacterium]|nr:tetratricopeptide repeat protein [Tepidisphaeraceae bacterium]
EPAIEVEAPAAVVTHEDEAELPPVLEEAEPVQPEVEFVPHSADEFKKRGRSRWRQGRYDEAAADFHAALDVDPADTEARTDLGLIALAQGDFRQGWPAYEAKLAESWPISALPQPGWEGSELANHRILLRAEQSITDAVQFIRYAPLVGKRGGRVIVRCRPELRHLLVDQPGILLLVSTTDPMPKFYTHCPIASLPRVMGTTPEEIPADVPYLLADGKLVDKWYARVSAEPEGLKVGVALRAGQRSAPSGEDSGSPASALGSIGRVSGVRFYALQPPGEQGDPALPSGVDATDWTSSLSDLAQTAALISCLDLVITSDNVVAHLAGALGRPTWLLLPFVADWRWMIGRNDSPWYPTMRLFRQPETGNWESPAQELIAELRRKVQEQ